jgi:hypothetical protein
MAEWLSAATAAAMMQQSVGPNDVDWNAAHAGSVAYVERKRKDLFVGTPGVFTPGADVLWGTALLINREYARRTSPLGTSQNVEFGGSDFLRYDPDIARFLGIGTEGKPVFGGARAAELDALEALQAEA